MDIDCARTKIHPLLGGYKRLLTSLIVPCQALTVLDSSTSSSSSDENRVSLRLDDDAVQMVFGSLKHLAVTHRTWRLIIKDGCSTKAGGYPISRMSLVSICT